MELTATQGPTERVTTRAVDTPVALEIARSALGQRFDTVSGLRRLTGGASRETWAFDAEGTFGRSVPLILQVERPGAVNGGGTMALEAAVQRAARGAGVPVPEVLATGAKHPLGRPYLLLERLTGETIPRRVLRAPELSVARQRFAAEAGELLARVHSIAPADVHGIDAADPVEQYSGVLHRLPAAYPALELGLRWLQWHEPCPGDRVVLHGDFRLGNLLFGETGIRGVLDWELCHVGDPAEDLAWLCLKAWRFGSGSPIGGLGEREELYRSYERASGRAVDPERVHWWEVFGNIKWAVICALQAQAHREGHVRSVELLSLGRKVSEVELELLGLLS
jgi:aminoglycoside phosphotransferase (APT) family kinase protein